MLKNTEKPVKSGLFEYMGEAIFGENSGKKGEQFPFLFLGKYHLE